MGVWVFIRLHSPAHDVSIPGTGCGLCAELKKRDGDADVREGYRATCFSDYEGMVKKVFDHLRPGGWVEYQVLPSAPYSPPPGNVGQNNISTGIYPGGNQQ